MAEEPLLERSVPGGDAFHRYRFSAQDIDDLVYPVLIQNRDDVKILARRHRSSINSLDGGGEGAVARPSNDLE